MSTSEVIFRQFEQSDLDAVRGLHEAALRATNAFGDRKWDDDFDDIPTHYLNNHGEFLVGLLNEDIVAMGAFRRISEKVAELKRMRVKPELQGQGIGRHLLGILEESAEAQGYTAIQLDTTVNQVASQHLYETAGYVELRREGEADGWPVEIIFYEKQLIPSSVR